jgi:large subunit ribosomal protein L35
MKQKTHSGAKKRFKLTGSKRKMKIVGRKASSRHLLANKSKSQKRQARKAFVMQANDVKIIRQLLKV